MSQENLANPNVRENPPRENLYLKLLLKLLSKLASVFWNLLVGLAGLIFVGGSSFLILYWPLKLLSDVHWLLGMWMGIVVISAFFMLWDQLKDFKFDNGSELLNKFRWLHMLMPFVQSLVAAVVSFAWISWLIHFTRSTHYATLSGSSLRDFVYYYFLLFLDMVPSLELLETLHLDYLIENNDFIGGIPIVLFRAFVIFVLLKFFRDNWKNINMQKASRRKPARKKAGNKYRRYRKWNDLESHL